jgi:hypothetical protein
MPEDYPHFVWTASSQPPARTAFLRTSALQFSIRPEVPLLAARPGERGGSCISCVKSTCSGGAPGEEDLDGAYPVVG